MRFATVFALLFTLFCTSVGSSSAAMNTTADAPGRHWIPADAMATYPEQEPNDSCPGPEGLGFMDSIDPARIDAAGDNDWYPFGATATQLIMTGTAAAQYCDPDAGDTYLYLYSSDCTTILREDDDSGPGSYSLINGYSAPYTGLYHIRVRHHSATGTGCYRLFLQGGTVPEGACCAYGECYLSGEADCPGQWMGPGTLCDTNPCPGACCFEDGHCEFVSEAECVAMGGIPQGLGSECDQNPCPPTPARNTTWGQIRSNYR